MEKYYGLFDCDLCFSTYKEFKEIKNIIFDAYFDMDIQEKAVYRMYVYSRPFVPEKTKELIWEEITTYYWMMKDSEDI